MSVQAPDSAPVYRGSVGPGDRAWDDAMALMHRLVALHRDRSTDQVGSIWSEPVDNYRDPALWQREMQQIHHRVPLPLGLSVEIAEPGQYKAMEVAGTPVIITRDADRKPRAFVNSCRHRGSALVEEGRGQATLFSCPYHAWSYALDGSLVSVYGEKTFGDFDHSGRGLVELPAEERAGVVFVGLTPGSTLDLDSWLGGAEAVLEGFRLADAHVHHSMRTLDGPNWKIVLDGYLEGYHFGPLHRNTVGKRNLSNIAAIDTWGGHIRNGFALRPIGEFVDKDPAGWDPVQCVGLIMWLFPGLAIAGGLRNQISVNIVMPGRTWDTSTTYQALLLRDEPTDEEEIKSADATSDWFHEVIRDEDYSTCFGIQRSLHSMAGKDFLFGRNEPGPQHFHRTVNTLTAGGAVIAQR